MIVIVEDNRGDVELIREALRAHHVETPVRVFSDGEQAWQMLQDLDDRGDSSPSLFILDLNLPRKSGLEVLERIRLSPHCATVPVVVLSSSSAEADRRESIRLGADRFISKPSSLDEFLNIGSVFKGYLKDGNRTAPSDIG